MARAMSHRDAANLLGITGRDADEIEAAFRAGVRSAHPDAGGTAARFRSMVVARQVLLDAVDRPEVRTPVRVTTRRDRLLVPWSRRRRRLLERLGRATPRVR